MKENKKIDYSDIKSEVFLRINSIENKTLSVFQDYIYNFFLFLDLLN